MSYIIIDPETQAPMGPYLSMQAKTTSREARSDTRAFTTIQAPDPLDGDPACSPSRLGLQHTEKIPWITSGIGFQVAGIRLKHAGFFHYLSNPEARYLTRYPSGWHDSACMVSRAPGGGGYLGLLCDPHQRAYARLHTVSVSELLL